MAIAISTEPFLNPWRGRADELPIADKEQELSQFLFRGSNFGRLDHREFSKQAFREHLNDRYSKQITDRIMLVLES